MKQFPLKKILDIEIESSESDDSSKDSCKKYAPTPEKSTFSKSMGDVNSN